jgi:hypothetical protein
MAELQGTTATDSLDLSSKAAREHVDRLLDQAIEDTFPTSDPVSLTMPHERAGENPASSRSALAARISSALPLVVIGGIVLALLLRRTGR